MNVSERGSELLKAFEYGIDYGLLIAEEERDSEGLADAVVCAVRSPRTCLPTYLSQRRQSRSAAWRKSKNDSVLAFIRLLIDDNGE